jgi:hypothetical protein
MLFTLRLKAENTAAGWTLYATVGGGFVWKAVLDYPGLSKGDIDGALGDDNPGAEFATLVGRVAHAMDRLGAPDLEADPMVYGGNTADPGVVCAFQGVCLGAAGDLLEIGYRKAKKHGSKIHPVDGRLAWVESRQAKKKKGK